MKVLFLILCITIGSQVAVAQTVAELTVQYHKQRKGKVAMVKHYNNGQVAETGWYKYALPHGAWARFNKDGQITTQAAFVNGLKHGTWKFWDHDGKLLCEIEYHYGQLITARQYSVNGNIIAAIGGR